MLENVISRALENSEINFFFHKVLFLENNPTLWQIPNSKFQMANGIWQMGIVNMGQIT